MPQTLHKKRSFPIRISSLNVTKSTGNCGFGYIWLQIHRKLRIWLHLVKKYLIENFIFYAVRNVKNKLNGWSTEYYLLHVIFHANKQN